MGLAFLCGVARRGPGWVVAARLSGPDMVATGGNCSIRGATRRRHAVTGLLMLPNPHSARCVGGIRCPDGCDLVRRGQGWLFVACSGGFLGSM